MLNIRRGTIDDADTIVRFNMEMARETENIALSPHKLKKGVASVFEDSSKGFYVIAECDGDVVGQALITHEWSDWRNSFFWWIQSVYVVPDYRRTGVFRAIFEHIKRAAESASNVCGLRLYVDKNNHIAKRTYESLGMERSHYELYEILLTRYRG